MLTAWVSIAVVAAGACSLVLLGRRFADGGRSVVARNMRYQPIALGVAVLAVLAVRLLVPEHADYLAVGDWSAPVSGMAWLGVADGDSWATVGLTFLVIMTVVTAVTVWLLVGRKAGVGFPALLRAVPVGLLFALVNALAEELLFRLAVTEALAPVASMTVVAVVSAILFGVPHWFGNPGRLVGVMLAGFLGWFLALSVLQTGGMGWALTIHVTLDVVIFTILVAADSARARTASPQPVRT